MSAPFNLIQDKAEQALQILIRQAATGVPDNNVFTTFVSGSLTVGTHHISIIASGGIEDGHNAGDYRISVTVSVQSSLDQAVEAEGTNEVEIHREYAGKVFDALTDTDLAANMTAAVADFTVFDSIERRHGRQRVENRKAVSEMLLEFTAVPSDIEES